MWKKKTLKPGRLHLLDEYRGFVVIHMILYHAIWDLVYMFGVDWQWYRSEGAHIWQQWICWSFILVSGFCWKMGRNPMKRGLLVYAGGVVISLVTLIAMPYARVMFGILTLLGSAMLLMIPLDLVCRKIPPLLGAVVSFLIFCFAYPVSNGYFGFGEYRMISLPEEWYANVFTTYLGFAEPGFYSTDYFSLIPWFFLFVTGYFLYGVVLGNKEKDNQIAKILQKSVCAPLGWVGRNALVIYMLHQPVVYAVLILLVRT